MSGSRTVRLMIWTVIASSRSSVRSVTVDRTNSLGIRCGTMAINMSAWKTSGREAE